MTVPIPSATAISAIANETPRFTAPSSSPGSIWQWMSTKDIGLLTTNPAKRFLAKAVSGYPIGQPSDVGT